MLEAKQPIIMVVDGNSIHKAKSIKSYVESTQGRLELIYLPPYSPQLNPDEQVWKHVKADIAKHPIANKFDFRLADEKALSRLQSMTHNSTNRNFPSNAPKRRLDEAYAWCSGTQPRNAPGRLQWASGWTHA